MKIRHYNPEIDYSQIEYLYKLPNSFGGEFDKYRDSKERIDILSREKSNCILVAEKASKIIGTVTLFEDARSAWLYRFAIQKDNKQEVALSLWNEAKIIMKERGHSQILVYTPTGNKDFEKRYIELGFNKGSDYTAYWQDLD